MKFKMVFSSVIILVGAILLGFSLRAQDRTTTLDPRIAEVYRDNKQLLSEARVNALMQLLNERVEIKEEAFVSGEKHQLLSTVPLFNKYNTALTRDVTFDLNTFNVLKYNLAFFENRDALYRVDNTNFVIIIHQQAYRR
ncbi:hypothetical protein M2306_002412 [Myroides gitamensis]|uniref:Uncharacterized protein n=1 Tax=Myroides odoratus TaxID=256 RepID=A0A378U3L1_MYROD|nr:hypothetical protein [Myroides odoratus]MCS4237542.1 hypothetical protein [Myroides odoratus]MDH6601718.1 hypothetical protein [Myroides gitamensis]QQU02927.1 hypothetical protein I6I89_14065 [Myroides odoratus]STZ69838.1 Uncharacterised protein [Myroides odoratus]